MRISKYKKFFAKGYSQNWSEEVFVVCNIKNKVSRTYVTSDLNGEKIDGIKMSQYFPKPCRSLEEILMLTLIFQIMQQKLILKL